MAADLALAGFDVRLYEAPEFVEEFKPVIESGEIEITGAARTGVARLDEVTTDIEVAVEEADVINVVVPAFAHETFYTRLAPHLQDGQVVVTHNGAFGSLQLAKILKDMGIDKDILIGDTAQLIYACRKKAPCKVNVSGVKSVVTFSTLPASNTGSALKAINRLYPGFIAATNILETGLENLQYIFHPTIMLLNAGRVPKGFLFYAEGVTPSISRVMEELDNERIAVEKALGLKATSAKEWLNRSYGSSGTDLYETIQGTKSYRKSLAPTSFKFRYITEDVPYGLVPLASLGKLLSIPTPIANALVRIASIINNVDYWHEGLTLEKLGLARKSLQRIKELVS